MQVTINGDVNEVPQDSSIQDILVSRTIPEDMAIVALNDEVIKRDRWSDVKLNTNDNLEIIRIIGGG